MAIMKGNKGPVELARRYITDAQGREGEEGESSASTPRAAQLVLHGTVHYWNAAATILYLRDALLVQLPTS